MNITTTTDLYIEHKNHLLRVCVRSDDKLAYRKCKYGCGLVVGIKKYEEYVIENSNAFLPYFR